MHSSRMRTTRFGDHHQMSVWGSALPSRGCTFVGVYLPGVYLPRGRTFPGGCAFQWSVPSRGCVRHTHPPEGIWDQAYTCPCGQTHLREHYLPVTLLAGGKYNFIERRFFWLRQTLLNFVFDISS